MRRSRLQYNKSPAKQRFRKERVERRPYLPYGRDIDRDERDRNEEERVSYFCDLCKQQMSNKEVYLSHCESAFHKEKENNAIKATNDNLWKCHSCEKTFPSKVDVDQHCLLYRHQALYRIEGLPKAKEPEKPKEKSPLRKLFSFGALMPPNYCDVCKVDCLNPTNLRIHLESWRHRAAVDRKKEEEEGEEKKSKTEPETAKANQEVADIDKGKDDEENKNDKDKKATQNHCDICSIRVTARAGYIEHITGKRHTMKLRCMKSPYNCIKCDRRYSSEKEFSEHLESERHIERLGFTARDWKDDKDFKDKKEIDRGSRESSKDYGKHNIRNRSRDGSMKRGRRDSGDRNEKYNDRRSRDRSRSRERVQFKERSRGRSREKKDRREKNKTFDESPSRSFEDVKSSGEKSFKKNDDSKRKDGKTGDESKDVKVGRNEDEVEEDREVRIKKDEDTKEVHDLREKLNKGKNIVITKKVKDEKGLDIIDVEERHVSDRTHPFTSTVEGDNPRDLDEELLKLRLKSDILLQEQLLKEHSIEILKYKDAEDEYKRLCLEESFLKRRLSMFRENDPRRENDMSDLMRVERAIGEVREELEVRDMIIQEKERSLIILKNRMQEQIDTSTNVNTASDALKHGNKPTDAPKKHTGDTSNKSLYESTSGVKVEEANPEKEKIDDLRNEIEKERLLRKLEPELNDLDPSFRYRILNALNITDSQNMNVKEETVFNKKSDLREELDQCRGTVEKRPSYPGEQQQSFVKPEKDKRSSSTKEKGMDEKTKSQHREKGSKKSKERKTTESSDSSDEEKPSKRKKASSSNKKKNKTEKRKKGKIDDSPELSKESRKKGKSVSPIVKKRERSRSISSSADEKKSKKVKSKKKDSYTERSKKIKKSTTTDDHEKVTKDANKESSDTKTEDNNKLKNISVILKKRSYITGLNIYDDKNNEKNIDPPMISEEYSDRIPVRRQLSDSPIENFGSMQKNDRPREQFALWKSTNVVKEENRDDIWDTAFNPGQKESSDAMAIDVFANSDDDASDFTQGKLIRMMQRSNKEATRNREENQMKRSLARQRDSTIYSTPRNIEERPTRYPDEDDNYMMRKSSLMLEQQQQPERLPENRLMIDSQKESKAAVKRGILKKPTEKFVEKTEEMKDPSKRKEKKDDETIIPGLNVAPSRDSSTQQDKERREEKVTPMDLEKINFILESFKKQYGSELDSSQIESDLKMVLEKQHLQMTSSRLPEQTSRQFIGKDHPINKLPESHDSIRQENPEESSRYDFANIHYSEQRSSQKNPLFPVKIPGSDAESFTAVKSLPARREQDIKMNPVDDSDIRKSLVERKTEKPIFKSFKDFPDDRSQRLDEPLFKAGKTDDFNSTYSANRELLPGFRSIENQKDGSVEKDGRPRSPYFAQRTGNNQADWQVRDDGYIQGRQQREMPYENPVSIRPGAGNESRSMQHYENRDVKMFENDRYPPSNRVSEYDASTRPAYRFGEREFQHRNQIDRPMERLPERHSMERPNEHSPVEHPMVRMGERPMEHSPMERSVDHPRERPVERGQMEHPADRPGERGQMERPAERPVERGPMERPADRPGERGPMERPAERNLVDRPWERPTERNPIGRPMERPAEHIPKERLDRISSDQQMKGFGNYGDRMKTFENETWTGQRKSSEWTTPQQTWKTDERGWKDESYAEAKRNPYQSISLMKSEEQRGPMQRMHHPRSESIGNTIADRFTSKTMERSSNQTTSKSNEDTDPFQYIVKTTNEQLSRGIFHCTVCKIFLATENDRAIHVYSQAHMEAISRKEEAIVTSSYASGMPNTQMRGNPRSANSFPSYERNIPRPLTMQRGERPIRPYEQRERQFRPRDNVNPRYSGPYY